MNYWILFIVWLATWIIDINCRRKLMKELDWCKKIIKTYEKIFYEENNLKENK